MEYSINSSHLTNPIHIITSLDGNELITSICQLIINKIIKSIRDDIYTFES